MQPRAEPVNAAPSSATAARGGGIRAKLWQAVQAGLDGSVTPLADRPLRPLIAEYTAIFGSTWRPMTRRKHRDDFARFVDWLEREGRPVPIASLDFATLVAYVEPLRRRPAIAGVWR